MTVANHIKCPNCGQVFHLKFQVDNSVYWSEWPVVLECPGCNDPMEMTYSSKGLRPTPKKAERDEPGIVVCYCGGLPTPGCLYYQKDSGVGFHSIFLTLWGSISEEAMESYKLSLRRLQEGIVRWANSLEISYRMISGKKINPKAYYNKMKAIFEDDLPKERYKTPEDCKTHYDEMVATVYRAMNVGAFCDGPLHKLLDSLRLDLVNQAGPEKIVECAEKAAYSKSVLHEVRTRINTTVKNLSKVLPALFLDFNGGDDADLFLLTGSVDDLNNIYSSNYEVICKTLPLLAAMYNLVNNGNPDSFKNADGSLAEGDLKKFAALDNGKKVNLLMGLPDFHDAISDILNTKIRNGVRHENLEYDIDTQTCEYHYDNSRPDLLITVRLIDLAHAILNQLRYFLMIYRMLLLIDKCRL